MPLFILSCLCAYNQSLCLGQYPALCQHYKKCGTSRLHLSAQFRKTTTKDNLNGATCIQITRLVIQSVKIEEKEKVQNQAAITSTHVSMGVQWREKKNKWTEEKGEKEWRERSERVLAWHNEHYLLACDSVRDRDRVQTLDTSCSAS